MKSYDKITFERTLINNETGEIIKQEFTHKKGTEPTFIKLYIDCLCDFKGLSKSLNPILLELLKYMTYASTLDPSGGQIIYLNAALKQNIAKSTGKSVKRIEQAITNFVKSGIFKRIATATYQVNAKLFGRGDWKDIKNIRATFDFGNGTVKTEIIPKLKNKSYC